MKPVLTEAYYVELGAVEFDDFVPAQKCSGLDRSAYSASRSCDDDSHLPAIIL